ncbi:MAG: hypothetical protein A3I29_00635 [Candidatus Magasanikbacteria bacterium RIFCSPLOWO2_02_FULL_44_11]|uniref:Uncharacterized protein n=1 Tax=Candidatus Magasanikbacteria bacterium RIFCSPLOWO2_02_FULL_44_11 TaxID=1798689 RepID=A0A1F6NB02_9BACT|nr:MAG: hypothetical protein A3I29_00635 [Candidatus Magasanikbacteria bacterium RIFCSPLOWO2_02_FULL_44_11]
MEEITTKQIVLGIFLIVLLIGGYILADLSLGWLNKEDVTMGVKVRIPETEKVATSTIIVEPKEEILQLIKKQYSPPQDIYSNADSYEKNLISWAIKGEFAIAKIVVRGEVRNDLPNFVSLSLGDISGTLGGSRKSVTQLDFNNSNAVFTKENPLEFTIDLKSPIRLSTTRDEFLTTFESSKNIILWDIIAPPPDNGTIAKMIIAPYSSQGKYGEGTIITSVEFRYACVEYDPNCKAILCPDKEYQHGSECIRDVFGAETAKNYSDYFRKK